MAAHKIPEDLRVCSFCGSRKYVTLSKIGMLCHKHYSQFQRLGRLLDKTFMDKNDIINNNDGTSFIIARNKKLEEVGRIIVDTADVDMLSVYSWRIGTCNKVSTSIKSKDGRRSTVMIHRMITNCPDNLVVDHINGNRLDNRRCNLRICTQKDNRHNVHKVASRGSNKYVGVRQKNGRFEAFIQRKYLGSFDSEEKAYEIRRAAEKELYGEFMADYQQTRQTINK